MLPLRPFELVVPETVDAAVGALGPGSRLVAGGTDLLPALKHRIESPERLVSLHRIGALRLIELDEARAELRIGCAVTLAALAADARVRDLFPSLGEAAASVGGPQLRNSATLGGNLHAAPRCRYLNQTEPWRDALGGCLRTGAGVCHVVESGRRCVAALSSDCVPVLVSLDARLVLAGPGGARELPLAGYYRADGAHHVARADDELATEVRLPLPDGPRRTAYVKWRPRRAIDYPLVSVALRLDLDREGEGALVLDARIVAAVLATKPRVVMASVGGLRLDDPRLPSRMADAVHEQCRPLPNVPYDPDYRRRLLRVLTRRAVEALARAAP
jgi:4-hydroxybenzoyl-CoA reductase subunit beta